MFLLLALILIGCDACPDGVDAFADGTCPTGDCAVAWEDLGVDENAAHVDANAAGGGDGSAAKPYSTVQAALDARATVVAIDPGTYRENLVLNDDVRLVGRCIDSVIIDGSGGDAEASTISAEGGGAVGLRNLTIAGAPHDGVLLVDSGGEL